MIAIRLMAVVGATWLLLTGCSARAEPQATSTAESPATPTVALSPAMATAPAALETATSTPPVVFSPEPTATLAIETTPTVVTVAGGVSFSGDVYPILRRYCLRCHGGQKTEEGLSVATYEKLMAGSKNGAVVIPGDPENSELIQSVVSGEMPKRGPKPTAEQIQILIDWVRQGAPNN